MMDEYDRINAVISEAINGRAVGEISEAEFVAIIHRLVQNGERDAAEELMRQRDVEMMLIGKFN